MVIFCRCVFVFSQGVSPRTAQPRLRGGPELGVEYRYADGVSERFPNRGGAGPSKVDVIVTTAGPPSRAAKQATTTIPLSLLKFLPVLEGLVASLARPEYHRIIPNRPGDGWKTVGTLKKLS
jgi:hypothetical protein